MALLIGAIGYGASITLRVAGARDLGAARGQLVFATAPFVGAIVAWTLFAERVEGLAPTLLCIVGVGALTAAKIIAETADVRRFKSKDAYARRNGTAPLPVWSGNTPRHRLSRTGNRQLNAAIHRIAVTQKHCHDDAHTYLKRRQDELHNTRTEALRALKRRLSDVVYRALLEDAPPATATPANLLSAAA